MSRVAAATGNSRRGLTIFLWRASYQPLTIVCCYGRLPLDVREAGIPRRQPASVSVLAGKSCHVTHYALVANARACNEDTSERERDREETELHVARPQGGRVELCLKGARQALRALLVREGARETGAAVIVACGAEGARAHLLRLDNHLEIDAGGGREQRRRKGRHRADAKEASICSAHRIDASATSSHFWAKKLARTDSGHAVRRKEDANTFFVLLMKTDCSRLIESRAPCVKMLCALRAPAERCDVTSSPAAPPRYSRAQQLQPGAARMIKSGK
eukprot:1978097-Pleurochrysis_carterae.AAC.5